MPSQAAPRPDDTLETPPSDRTRLILDVPLGIPGEKGALVPRDVRRQAEHGPALALTQAVKLIRAKAQELGLKVHTQIGTPPEDPGVLRLLVLAKDGLPGPHLTEALVSALLLKASVFAFLRTGLDLHEPRRVVLSDVPSDDPLVIVVSDRVVYEHIGEVLKEDFARPGERAGYAATSAGGQVIPLPGSFGKGCWADRDRQPTEETATVRVMRLDDGDVLNCKLIRLGDGKVLELPLPTALRRRAARAFGEDTTLKVTLCHTRLELAGYVVEDEWALADICV